jgi:hypothetical protein
MHTWFGIMNESTGELVSDGEKVYPFFRRFRRTAEARRRELQQRCPSTRFRIVLVNFSFSEEQGQRRSDG